MALVSRRLVVLGVSVGLLQGRAFAAELSYKGWSFITEAGIENLPEDTVRSLKSQADIVDSLLIKPEIQAFFHGVPLEVDPTTSGGAGAYSFERHKMFLSMRPDPPQNPVFLHELLHAYHDQRLPAGRRNPQIREFYEKTLKSGAFEDRSYMLSNVIEFFAMCTSVVLWGRAARPPYTRKAVQEHIPDFYAWIATEFYQEGTGPN